MGRHLIVKDVWLSISQSHEDARGILISSIIRLQCPISPTALYGANQPTSQLCVL